MMQWAGNCYVWLRLEKYNMQEKLVKKHKAFFGFDLKGCPERVQWLETKSSCFGVWSTRGPSWTQSPVMKSNYYSAYYNKYYQLSCTLSSSESRWKYLPLFLNCVFMWESQRVKIKSCRVTWNNFLSSKYVFCTF